MRPASFALSPLTPRNSGKPETTRFKNVVRGSAFETTTRDSISSPPSITTLPVSPLTPATFADVRISTPVALAALAKASDNAPIPPFAYEADPIALPSSAACHNNPKLVPADHGPANAPWIPRAATAARNNSVSNHSPTRSATAIGPQRNNRYSSFLPSPRNARPTLPSCHKSAAAG